MSHNETPGRARNALLAALMLVATFVTGVVAGVAGDRFVLVREARILPREGMRFVSSRIVRAMDRELDLSDVQRANVERILAERQERIEKVWTGIRPQVRAEIEKTNREIEAVLTEAQRPRFRQLTARWQARLERLQGRQTP